jgi:hypothetical protein
MTATILADARIQLDYHGTKTLVSSIQLVYQNGNVSRKQLFVRQPQLAVLACDAVEQIDFTQVCALRSYNAHTFNAHLYVDECNFTKLRAIHCHGSEAVISDIAVQPNSQIP